MRKKILLALAIPVGVYVAGKVASALSEHGHDRAGSRLQKAADLLGRNKRS